MRKKIENNAILLDQALYSGASFVTTLLLSRVLTLSQFGLFSTFILVLFLFSSVTQAIVVQPMQTKAKELLTENSYGKFLISVQGLFAALFLLVGILLHLFGNGLLGNDNQSIVHFSAYASLFLLHDFFRKYYLARAEKMFCLILDGIYVSFLFIGLGAVYWFSIDQLASIFDILSLSLVPTIAYAGITTVFKLKKGKTNWTYIHYHLKEGKWFLMAAISQWFSNNIFVMSSGIFLSMEALGALRLVQTVFGIFNIFLQSVENFIIPQVNRMVDESLADAVHYLNQLLRKSLVFLLPFLILLFVFSKPVIEFLGGEKYLPYHYAIKGFAVLYLVIFLFYPIRILIRALAKNKSFFVAYLISGCVGLLTCNFLFENFALLGAVIGLIISQVIMITLWFSSLKKQQINLWKLYI